MQRFAALLRKTMEELKRNDFDPNAAVRKPVEPEPKGMMDDFQGLGGGSSSFGSSRDEKRSNSTNVYGTTLGGDGINPFKIKN